MEKQNSRRKVSKNSSDQRSEWINLAAGWSGRNRRANNYICVKLSQELIEMIKRGKFTKDDKFYFYVNEKKEELAENRDTSRWPDWTAEIKAEASDEVDVSDLF